MSEISIDFGLVKDGRNDISEISINLGLMNEETKRANSALILV